MPLDEGRLGRPGLDLPRILVAEDNTDDFLLLQLALKRKRLPVSLQRVDDGQAAIDFLTKLEAQSQCRGSLMPDLFLVDLKMPRASGFEVIRWVRSRPALKRMVVVVLSSSGHLQDINLAYDLGANSYVEKAGTLDEFGARMDRVLQYWTGCSERPRWESKIQ